MLLEVVEKSFHKFISLLIELKYVFGCKIDGELRKVLVNQLISQASQLEKGLD